MTTIMSRQPSKYAVWMISTGVVIICILLLDSVWNMSNEHEDKTKGSTMIRINNNRAELGKIDILNEVDAEFIIKNIGSEHLYIDHIEVSCNCTSGEVTKEAIAPGDSVSIFVTYNKKIPGYFYQDVLVFGNFSTSPEILSFEGYLMNASN